MRHAAIVRMHSCDGLTAHKMPSNPVLKNLNPRVFPTWRDLWDSSGDISSLLAKADAACAGAAEEISECPAGSAPTIHRQSETYSMQLRSGRKTILLRMQQCDPTPCAALQNHL